MNNNNIDMSIFMPYDDIGLELARAYVPNQPYVGMLPLDEALKKGSLFPNLFDPYESKKNKSNKDVDCK